MLDRKAIQEQIEPQIQDNYVTVKVTNGDIAIAQDNVDDNGVITLPSNEYNHMIEVNEKGLPYANQIFVDVSEVDLTPSSDVIMNAIRFKNISTAQEIMNPIYSFANVNLVTLDQTQDTLMQYTIEKNKTLMLIYFQRVARNIIMIIHCITNTGSSTISVNNFINRDLSELFGYSVYIYSQNGLENIPTYFLLQFEDENGHEVISKIDYCSNRSSGGSSNILLSNVDFIFSESSFDFSNFDFPWDQPTPTP